MAHIEVVGANPMGQYNIRLIQLPTSLNDCGSYLSSSIIIDSSGNGSTDVSEALLSGATGVFVVLNWNDNPGDYYFTTQTVNFMN